MIIKSDSNNSWAAKVSTNNHVCYSHGDCSQKYELASLSKAFTALAIVLLSLEKNFSLDEDVATFDDHLRFRDRDNKVYPVSFRNLLHHTSGLDKYTIRFQKSGENSILQTAYNICNSKLVCNPDGKYSYATGGYVILGALVEIISGMPFANFVQERILFPLGMYASDASGESLGGFKLGAFGYRRIQWKGCRAFAPAGYISSTVNDMLIFLDAFAKGKCLDRNLENAIHICQDTHNYIKTGVDGVWYGFGWFWNEKLDLFYHDGCNPGFTSYMAYQNHGDKICSIWLLNYNEGSFVKTAESYVIKLVKKEHIEIKFGLKNHALKKVIFYIELGIILMILKNHNYLLWCWFIIYILLNKIISWKMGNLTLKQIYLWTNLFTMGVLYNSVFLWLLILVYVIKRFVLLGIS